MQKETSEGQSANQEENKQALREAQISQSKKMLTPKNHDSNATTDSDEVEVLSFHSLTKGPVQGSPPIKTEPGPVSVPQTANADEAQARIDKIIHGSTFAPPHSRNSIATPGILGKKEYYKYYLRTGKCDSMQAGCKYKHEYPEDEETLGKLTSRHTIKHHEHQAFSARNSTALITSGLACVTTCKKDTGISMSSQRMRRHGERLNLCKLLRRLEERQAQAFMYSTGTRPS